MLYFYGGHSTINASLLTVTMGRVYHCRRMQTVDASFNRVLFEEFDNNFMLEILLQKIYI